MFDPELYRSREEVEAWRRRCPIETLAASLLASRELDASLRLALEREAQAEVEDAIAFAQAGTWEPVENLLDHVGALRAGGGA
jgi:pyruvate dehydrogenase E1 component alpha subunit